MMEYNDRQVKILSFILKQKESGRKEISLDEISDHLSLTGQGAHRNSLISGMKVLTKKFNANPFGTFSITPVENRGRGRKQIYRIDSR